MNYYQRDYISRMNRKNIGPPERILDPKLKKTTMSVPEMRKLLGVKKTESYWLVHKGYFQTDIIGGQMRINIESFEKWYANQVKHKKVTGEEPGLELKKTSYSARDVSEILGIPESDVYEIWKKENLKTITVDYWKRLPIEEFERWYKGQSRYRTKEDKLRDAPLEEESISMPEMARLLGIPRSNVYHIIDHSKYSDLLETIVIADRRRVTKKSFQNFLQMQSRYTLASESYAEEIDVVVPKYFTKLEAAEFAGVSVSSIDRYINKGEFPIARAGRQIRIPSREFISWVRDNLRKENADGIN